MEVGWFPGGSKKKLVRGVFLPEITKMQDLQKRLQGCTEVQHLHMVVDFFVAEELFFIKKTHARTAKTCLFWNGSCKFSWLGPEKHVCLLDGED